jgi:small-conductance mechanosensitive channel
MSPKIVGRQDIAAITCIVITIFATSIDISGQYAVGQGQQNASQSSTNLTEDLSFPPIVTIIQTIAILIVGFIIARIAKSIVSKRSKSTLPSDYSRRLTLLVYYGIIAITVISALAQSGIDLAGLYLASGMAGIVIGFATQSLFSNLISGIFLYMDKPFKVGDPVMIKGELPDVAGVVVNIGVITSRFRIFDGTYVTLPNTDVFSSEIYNYSATVARRIQITIGIGFNENADTAIEVMKGSLLDTPLVLIEPVPNIYVASIAEGVININIWCWVPSNVFDAMQMQLTNQIKKALTENNIEIPLPQQIIYVRNRTDGG